MVDLSLDACRAFVRAQRSGHASADHSPPAITISREVGAGGLTVGQTVCEQLRALQGPNQPPWTLFDKNLVQQILADHDLPEQIGRFIVEEANPATEVFIEEVLGSRPSEAELFDATARTITKLAQMGSCVLVGRGANFLTRRMRHVLQVRLVASVEARARRIAELRGQGLDEALGWVRQTDKARARYIKRHFNQSVADPAGYDLVINTETLQPHEAAAIIAAGVQALQRR